MQNVATTNRGIASIDRAARISSIEAIADVVRQALSLIRRHRSLGRAARSRVIVTAGFVVASMFTACVDAHAISPDKDLIQCRMDRWGTANGLLPRPINDITQSSDGYIWLATDCGLVRFDGETFRYFATRNTTGLTRDLISTVAGGPDGQLWVGTNGGGFGTFKDGVFKRIDTDDPDWSRVYQFQNAPNGDLWVCSHGRYLASVIRKGKLIRLLEARKDVPDECWAFKATAIDSHGTRWFAAPATGLISLSPAGKTRAIKLEPGVDTFPTSLVLDRDGSIWVGTTETGLFHYVDGKVEHYTTANGLPSNDVFSLLRDHAGNLWIGSGQGISRYANGQFATFGRKDGLGDDSVRAMYEDREGCLWVAAGNELDRFVDTKLTPIVLRTCGSVDSIYHICPARAGGIWIAEQTGLYRWDHGIAAQVPLPTGVRSSVVSNVVEAPDGTLAIISDWSNVYLLRHGKWIDTGLKSAKQIVWDGKQLIAYDSDKLKKVADRSIYLPLGLLSLGTVFSTYTAPDGIVWIGCEHGLAKIDHGRLTILNAGLPSPCHVLWVTSDLNGNIWAATDKGLAELQGSTFRLFTHADGLPDDNLYEIACDRQGALWVGGGFGLCRIRLEDRGDGRRPALRTTVFDAGDGIKSYPMGNDVWSATSTSDGRLWFEGDEGITVVDPRHLTTNTAPPPVHIEQVLAGGRHIPRDVSMIIPPDRRSIEIDYAGLSYPAPERVHFRYRLIGFDKDWVEAGGRRSAFYTNLAPGKYTFQVIACNNDGVWNLDGDTIALVLTPRFYETAWFQILSIVALLVAAAALFRYRLRALHRRNLELESKVADRTVELSERNEELEAMQSELEAQFTELVAVQDTLAQANARLEQLATMDGLTGLKNHRSFKEQLETEWKQAERYKSALSMVLLDIDHFKQYNDTYGHPAGDDILRTVGRLLRDAARESDFVARYGGEEFAVILPQTGPEGAIATAERIREAIEAGPWTLRPVTASIGVATVDTAMTNLNDLITAADTALYQSKHNGRNRVTMATATTDTPSSIG